MEVGTVLFLFLFLFLFNDIGILLILSILVGTLSASVWHEEFSSVSCPTPQDHLWPNTCFAQTIDVMLLVIGMQRRVAITKPTNAEVGLQLIQTGKILVRLVHSAQVTKACDQRPIAR
jgi:hypothetical protein